MVSTRRRSARTLPGPRTSRTEQSDAVSDAGQVNGHIQGVPGATAMEVPRSLRGRPHDVFVVGARIPARRRARERVSVQSAHHSGPRTSTPRSAIARRPCGVTRRNSAREFVMGGSDVMAPSRIMPNAWLRRRFRRRGLRPCARCSRWETMRSPARSRRQWRLRASARAWEIRAVARRRHVRACARLFGVRAIWAARLVGLVEGGVRHASWPGDAALSGVESARPRTASRVGDDGVSGDRRGPSAGFALLIQQVEDFSLVDHDGSGQGTEREDEGPRSGRGQRSRWRPDRPPFHSSPFFGLRVRQP